RVSAQGGATQLSLFDTVMERQKKMLLQGKPIPGSFDLSLRIREMLTAGLKSCDLSRYEVAARMSELVGAEITKSQLDSWSAESKEGHRFPAEYLAAFCFVTGYREPIRVMAELVNCHLVESREALLAELGNLNQAKRDMTRREKAIRDLLREMG
ncbi:MAG: hypothetical protein ACM3ZC_01290, partial [Bacteroidota bacterium]